MGISVCPCICSIKKVRNYVYIIITIFNQKIFKCGHYAIENKPINILFLLIKGLAFKVFDQEKFSKLAILLVFIGQEKKLI